MKAGEHQLHLLGGFQILVDDCAHPVPTSAAKLLALLAIHDRPMSRARVAGTFWPDLSDRRASANLRAVVWRLPAALRPVVASTATTLAISEAVDFDLRAARRIVRDILDLDEPHRHDSSCVALLCAPLLPEWDEEWLMFERERVRQLHIHALERLGASLLERGDALSAVDVGAAVISTEPLRESAHGLLIQAHLAAGNRADARRCYDRYCDLVRRELGLEPALGWPETNAVATRR